MKKGFLLNPRAVAASSLANTMLAAVQDNLLCACKVRERLAAGATSLRIECDFVTCSQ